MKPSATLDNMPRYSGSTPYVFLLFFCVSFLVLVWRCPSPLLFPDFYAEDGRDYLLLLPSSFPHFSFLATLPHDGFLLFGNVLLAQLGIFLNMALFRGEIADLPRSFSLMSYVAFATLIGATGVLLRKRAGMWTASFTCLWLCVLPLPRYPELILGRISNCGLLAFFAAVLIVFQRTLYTKTQANAVLCDLMFVICIFTNPVTLLLTPFLYAHALRDLYRTHRLSMSRTELFSAMTVLACCGVYIASCLHNRVLSPAKYMKGPFLWQHGIEVLFGRSILFPLIYPVYERMSDRLILPIMAAVAVLVCIVIWRGTGTVRWWYCVLVFSLGVFSVIALIFRPGFSFFVGNYQWVRLSHPEFFYLQNVLAVLFFATLLHDLAPAARLPRTVGAVSCATALICALVVSQGSRVGVWNLWLGTFEQEMELRYWERSYVAWEDTYGEHIYQWKRKGIFLQFRTAPFDNVANHAWWPALLPRALVEKSRVAEGVFEKRVSQLTREAPHK